MSSAPSLSKRIRYADPNYEETVLKWYEEIGDNSSDNSDFEENFAIQSDHDSESEIEGKFIWLH